MSVDTSAVIDIPLKREKKDKPPPHQEVVEAVIGEAIAKGVGCNTHTAYLLIRVLYMVLDDISRRRYKNGYYVYEIYSENLLEVLKAVMPDNSLMPAAGTAHDLLNRHLIPDRGLTIIRLRCILPKSHCVIMVYEH